MWGNERVLTRIAILLGVALGVMAGIGGYTFIYARGASYLTSDPAACVNCHVMQEQYDGWLQSSHRSVAVCNDCHAPHDLVGKYVTKAQNGFWHSVVFTANTTPDAIRITARNQRVTDGTCRSCHAELTLGIGLGGHAEPEAACIGCHRNVGHLH